MKVNGPIVHKRSANCQIFIRGTPHTVSTQPAAKESKYFYANYDMHASKKEHSISECLYENEKEPEHLLGGTRQIKTSGKKSKGKRKMSMKISTALAGPATREVSKMIAAQHRTMLYQIRETNNLIPSNDEEEAIGDERNPDDVVDSNNSTGGPRTGERRVLDRGRVEVFRRQLLANEIHGRSSRIPGFRDMYRLGRARSFSTQVTQLRLRW